MTDVTAGSVPQKPLVHLDRGPVATVVLALIIGTIAIGALVDFRQALLFLIGSLLGITLYHASFGFTGGWRRLVVERRGASMRAQMLMIAVAAVAFIPLLSLGSAFGQPLAGAIAPVGISVLFGAALFGLGMQLGGGCGSGTLFTVGGGSSRMLVTLIFFIAGALLGTAHLPWWLELPALPPVSLGTSLGVPLALAITLAGLGAVAWISAVVERRVHGSLERPKPSRHQGWQRFFVGPWPLIGAGLALAGLNLATLLLAGHPWSVTYGFGLWGAKIAQVVGVPVSDWQFWTWPAQAKALQSSVLEDVTSVMDFGIILGAALAAGLAGKFAPKMQVPFLSLLAAAIGGTLMGYGARLSFGCNIGALFSGIASGSLHGWLWFAAAFTGSLAGIYLRPFFGLDSFKAK
ncbi:YeeE/YedE family protein [Mesorhizobium sp. DCY119]|uniref:YeeE/YedE family protein n=1 Tax=Mesorhizobium sp. DCY119 TaxID=2108445 RepID=UPI000E71B09B|nr:YeeE/YedE family protein [Mesorhizobium sp. DCY119]RJG40400.1 YeeE/YedE family protein [Mesorhizobium sp. DCY119]